MNRMWKLADQARQDALSALSLAEREQLVGLLERVQSALLQLEPKGASRRWTPRWMSEQA
jgi:hypothetical protein